MKKILSWLLAAVMVLSLCACGGTVEKNDDGFLINLGKGLAQRWAASEEMPSDYSSKNAEKQDKLKLINLEKDAIGSLEEYTFANSDLKNLAEQYVAALDSQAEGLKYLGNDPETYRSLYTEKGYYVRASVISQLVYDYNFKTNAKYENYLNDLLDAADVYNQEAATVQALGAVITDDVVLKATDMYSVSAQLKNTTGKDLTNVWINLSLLDHGNNVLDTYTNIFDTWADGETKEFEPYLSQEAAHYQITLSFVSSATGIEWTTEPQEVAYQPFDPGVEFVLCFDLPSDYTPSSWYSKATCHVTDFWTELSYSDGEKSAFEFHIAGSKTYDARGDNYSRSCHVEYRVTNEDRSVVYDSGSFYTDELLVGQSFSDCSSYVSELAPGTYYVELFAGKY